MNMLTNPFVTASAKGAAWLLVWSWQAAVLIACVWAGLKIFRVKSPALRHQVWLFALIAVAAMPILGGVVQSLPLPQPTNRALSYAVELPRIVVTNDAASLVQNQSPAVSVKPSVKRPIILSLSFALWLAGALIFVAKTAVNGAKLCRLRAGARLSLADLDCDECNCEGLRSGKVSLALSDEIRLPILLGVLRPMIVFPADIDAWTSPAERCAMSRHELAHVERRDHYANFFQTILGAIFFFHPLTRYACRQLTLEREMACDDHVVVSGAEAETYAESIIKAAERSIGAPGGAHQLALFSARHILERRIEMILNKDRMRVLAHHRRYLVLFVAMIAAVSVLLISTRAGKITAQPAIINNDQQTLVAIIRQVAEGIPRQIHLGSPSANPNIGFKDFVGASGVPMWRRFNSFARQNLTVTRVEVGDFKIEFTAANIEADVPHGIINAANGARAAIDFLGTIYFKDPVRGKEKSVADRYTVEMVKAHGQWMAVPQPPPPPPPPGPVDGVQNDAPPPPPPPPPPPSKMMTVAAGQELKPVVGDGGMFDLLREAADASIRRDTSFFERVFDEDYRETGPNGETMNKAQAIADVKRLDYEIKKFEFDDLSVSGNNHSAFATFLGTVYFHANGQDSTAQYRYTVNFIRRDGRLKIAAIQMTRKQ
jgi:beta-lactamase regulating signal transducer with metallopeptidase domain